MIAIENVVLIIIFIIILVVCIYVLVDYVKPNGEKINTQNRVRQCCTIFRAYNCDVTKISQIECNGSYLSDIINGVVTPDQLPSFCGC